MNAKIPLGENVSYVLRDRDGNIKKLFQHNFLGKFFHRFGIDLKIPFISGTRVDELIISNLITNAGFAGVASRLMGSGGEAIFNYIALGTGVTAANVSDTTLEAEITTDGLARATGTLSRITTDVSNDTAQSVKEFSVTGTKAVTETGVLNAASTGTLLARQVFSAVNVINGDTLSITWKFDID